MHTHTQINIKTSSKWSWDNGWHGQERRLKDLARAPDCVHNAHVPRRVRQGVWKGVLLRQVGGPGAWPRKFFFKQDTKKTTFWHTLIILYQCFTPSIAAQLAALWFVKLLVLKPAEQHVCKCFSQWCQTRKGENSWTPHVHRVYRGRQPVSPLPSAPGLSSRLPHPHKVKKFLSSWCHEESCLGETSLYTQAVQSKLWASRMWHSFRSSSRQSKALPYLKLVDLHCNGLRDSGVWNCTVQRHLHFNVCPENGVLLQSCWS